MRRTVIASIFLAMVAHTLVGRGSSATPTTAPPAAGKPAPDHGNPTLYRRAVEAVIWGMPAVNYDLMLQAMLAHTQAKENEVVYWSTPSDWKNQTLTPNPDAIYFMIFFNTKDGPVVIDVPPAESGSSLAANIDDVWQMPLADAGPEGSDQGKGGKYLVLPPGYMGKVPDGHFALRALTYGGYALLRSNLASHSEADITKAREYGKRLKVYRLSEQGPRGETKFTDAKDILFDSTIPFDVGSSARWIGLSRPSRG
jgi:hypothetical protein